MEARRLTTHDFCIRCFISVAIQLRGTHGALHLAAETIMLPLSVALGAFSAALCVQNLQPTLMHSHP